MAPGCDTSASSAATPLQRRLPWQPSSNVRGSLLLSHVVSKRVAAAVWVASVLCMASLACGVVCVASMAASTCRAAGSGACVAVIVVAPRGVVCVECAAVCVAWLSSFAHVTSWACRVLCVLCGVGCVAAVLVIFVVVLVVVLHRVLCLRTISHHLCVASASRAASTAASTCHAAGLGACLAVIVVVVLVVAVAVATPLTAGPTAAGHP